MTFPTGSKPIRGSGSTPRRAGFTLLELILVMATLAIVLSVAAPSLARFFRGRSLDSEARRFLTLTRYGQSRAVAEGEPMVSELPWQGSGDVVALASANCFLVVGQSKLELSAGEWVNVLPRRDVL